MKNRKTQTFIDQIPNENNFYCRRVTTVKFGRAASESRTMKTPISPDRQQQTIERRDSDVYSTYQTQQQRYVGHER